MNFEWDGKLAERQDRVLNVLYGMQKPAKEDAEILRRNRIVAFATILAPCNLSVRHYCILDILEGKASRLKKVNRIISLLTDNNKSLWLEGYSYWGYTERALRYYAERFGINDLRSFIGTMNLMFNRTGYVGQSGQHYPAPFGDLWHDVLDSQVTTMGASIPPVYRSSPSDKVIAIKCKAIRFNLHTSYINKVYNTNSGAPKEIGGVPFTFYTGYRNKYPTKWSELCAMVSRLFQLLSCVLYW